MLAELALKTSDKRFVRGVEGTNNVFDYNILLHREFLLSSLLRRKQPFMLALCATALSFSAALHR
jgi:hypothetical protein